MVCPWAHLKLIVKLPSLLTFLFFLCTYYSFIESRKWYKIIKNNHRGNVKATTRQIINSSFSEHVSCSPKLLVPFIFYKKSLLYIYYHIWYSNHPHEKDYLFNNWKTASQKNLPVRKFVNNARILNTKFIWFQSSYPFFHNSSCYSNDFQNNFHINIVLYLHLQYIKCLLEKSQNRHFKRKTKKNMFRGSILFA